MNISFSSHTFRRVLTVLLAAAAIAAPTLTACGQAAQTASSQTSAGTGAETAASDTVTAAASDTDLRDTLSDAVPDLDFNGKSFRSIVQDSTPYDIYVEQETGDALEDSIYYRNRAIEERFDIVIDPATALDYNAMSSKVVKSVTAGDDEYDLIIGQMETTGSDALKGVFMNWYNLQYCDFTQPWWPKSVARDAATVNGKMFCTVSDLCISYAAQTWSIIFDKVKAENNGVGDMYSVVNDGKWTVDKLAEVTQNVASDLDGNGTMDDKDFYGYVTALNGCLVLGYFYGFDQRLVTVENGAANMVLDTEKSSDICSKLYSLYYQSKGTYVPKDSSNAGMYDLFISGNTLFCPIEVQYLYTKLRGFEDDFGVLPFPKWDEAQSEYYSICDAGSNVMTVPVTETDTDFVGAIVEALSAYSWKTVLPTYCDIALAAKSTRDEDSVKMLYSILDSRVIDFAYLYDGWKGWVFTLPDMIKSADAFASTYAKKEASMQKYYDSVLKIFQ